MITLFESSEIMEINKEGKTMELHVCGAAWPELMKIDQLGFNE